MPAGLLDITIEEGATFSKVLVLTKIDGTPFDLTGYSGTGMVRKTKDSDVPLGTITFELVDATSGKARITIPAILTKKMPGGSYVYDVKIMNGDDVKRLIQGKAIVDSGVTK